MKHLLLTLIFSTSLAAFSQSMDTTQPLRQFDVSAWTNPNIKFEVVNIKPDTLRAIILATMCRKCAAEAIRGYVVIEQGKRPVYLDCRKRALRGSQVGWGYELIGGKEK